MREKTEDEEKKELKQQMGALAKEMEQLCLFNQNFLAQQSAGGQRGQQQYRMNQQGGQYKSGTQYNRNQNQTTETIPVNDQGCHWCGMNGHRRGACFDYKRAISEGIIHYTDSDSRVEMGLPGGGGPIIPLPQVSRMWQKTWVDNSRQRMEAQGTVPATSGDRIVEINEGTTG